MICVGVAQDYGTRTILGKKWDSCTYGIARNLFHLAGEIFSWIKLFDGRRPLCVSGIAASICYYMSGSAISVTLHEGLMLTRGRSPRVNINPRAT